MISPLWPTTAWDCCPLVVKWNWLLRHGEPFGGPRGSCGQPLRGSLSPGLGAWVNFVARLPPRLKFFAVRRIPHRRFTKLVARSPCGAEYGVEILLLLKTPTVARLGCSAPLSLEHVCVYSPRMQTARRWLSADGVARAKSANPCHSDGHGTHIETTLPHIAENTQPALTGCPHRGTNGFRASDSAHPHRGRGPWGYYDTGIACLRSRQRDDCPAFCEPEWDGRGFRRWGV